MLTEVGPKFDGSDNVSCYYDRESDQVVVGGLAVQQSFEKNGNQVRLKELGIPPHYYDLSTMQLLIGEDALSRHYELGGYGSEIFDLGEIVIDRSIEIPKSDQKPFQAIRLSRQDCLSYALWLQRIIKQTEPSAFLDYETITRANFLGVGPSYDQIVHHFDNSFSELCDFLGRPRPRRGAIRNWSVKKLVANTREIVQTTGKRPTEPSLVKRVAAGEEAASGWTIRQKTGSINTLLELSGERIFRSFEVVDYLDWGIKYRLANDGQIPTADKILMMSKQGLGPSWQSIRKNFGGMPFYVYVLKKKYQEKVAERQEEIGTVRMQLWYHCIPHEAFNGSRSDNEILRKYGQWQILHDPELPIINGLDESTKAELCRKYDDLDFILELIAIYEEAGTTDMPDIIQKLLVKRRRLYLDDFMNELKLPETTSD